MSPVSEAAVESAVLLGGVTHTPVSKFAQRIE